MPLSPWISSAGAFERGVANEERTWAKRLSPKSRWMRSWSGAATSITCPSRPGISTLRRGDGDAAEGFHPPRRTEEAGDGMQDVDPGVERRPDRFAVENRRVAFVLAPGRGTHVGHLPDSQRRTAKPAGVELPLSASGSGSSPSPPARRAASVLARAPGRSPPAHRPGSRPAAFPKRRASRPASAATLTS